MDEVKQSETASTLESIPDENTVNIILKDGEKVSLPYFITDNLRLYHGSPISGIQYFRDAEETTIGNGFYATSDIRSAGGYSVVRSNDLSKRFLYEIEIDGLKILDLSTQDAIINFGKFFREKLIDLRRRLSADTPNRQWVIQGVIDRNIREINLAIMGERQPHLKWFTENIGDLVRSSLLDIGCDGLLAYEGGEAGNGETIGRHDSYVIFDPTKAKVINEVPVKD